MVGLISARARATAARNAQRGRVLDNSDRRNWAGLGLGYTIILTHSLPCQLFIAFNYGTDPPEE